MHFLWYILSILAACIVIPSLGKTLIGRPAGLLVQLVLQNLGILKPSSLLIYLDILRFKLHIHNLKLNTHGLAPYIDIPLPIELNDVELGSLTLDFSFVITYLFAKKSIVKSGVSLILRDIRILAQLVEQDVYGTPEKVEKGRLRAHQTRQAEADIVTQLMEDELRRLESGNTGHVLNTVDSFLERIVGTLAVSINNVKFVVTQDVLKEELLSLGWSSLQLQSREKNETQCWRTIQWRELYLQVQKENVLTCPVLSSSIILPPVFQILLSPLPIKEKFMDIAVDTDELLFEVSPTSIAGINFLSDKLSRYSIFQQALVNEAESRCMELVDIQDNGKLMSNYSSLYQLSNKKVDKAHQQAIDDLEHQWTVESILYQRMHALNWPDRLRKVKQSEVCVITLEQLMDYVEEIQEVRTPLRKMDITLSFAHVSLALIEEGDPVASVLLEELDLVMGIVNVAESEDDSDNSPSLLVDILLSRLWCDVEVPSVGCSRSRLIDYDATSSVLTLIYTTSKVAGDKIDATLSGLKLLLLARPLECLLMFLDRLTASNCESVEADLESSGVDGSGSNEEIDDSSTEALASSVTLFKGKTLNYCVKVVDLGVCIGKSNTVKHDDLALAQVLELVLTCEGNIRSDGQSENIDVDISKIALIPRVVHPTSNGTPDVHASVEDSLLAPVSINFGYTHVQEPAKGKINCLQNISVTIPDILVTLSHSNLAILAGGFSELVSVQTSTPEQQELREEAQHRLMDNEKKLALKVRLETLRRAFETIDADKSQHIDVDELSTLIRHMDSHKMLLRSEVARLSKSVFDTIDDDGSGGIDFNEFKNYITNDYKAARLNGYLDLRCSEYVCPDGIYTLLGTDKPIDVEDEHTFLVKDTTAVNKFWEVLHSEADISETSLNGQSVETAQKKLIRLVKNFELAELYWSRLVALSLFNHAADSLSKSSAIDTYPWILNPSDSCGGLYDFASISAIFMAVDIASLNKAAKHALNAPGSFRRSSLKLVQTVPIYDLYLAVKSKISIGNVRIHLVDQNLPAGTSRATIFLGNTKVYASLSSPITGEKNDSLISSESEWSVTLTCLVDGKCYSDLADCMEPIIEPWTLSAGALSKKGEVGYAAMVEAEKRLQVNVTNAVLRTMGLVIEIAGGKHAVHATEHELALVNSVEEGFNVSNYSGIGLRVSAGEKHNESLLVGDKCTALFSNRVDGSPRPGQTDTMPTVINVDIDGWGARERIPISGCCTTSFRVFQDCEGYEDGRVPFIPLICSIKSIPGKGSSLVLKSNVSIRNETGRAINVRIHYNSQILKAGEGSRDLEFNEIKLRSKDKQLVPLTIFTSSADMIIAETNESGTKTTKRIVSIKPELFQFASSDNDDDDEFKDLIMLSPDVHLVSRPSKHREQEWDIVVLPRLTLKNSLPYTIEYAFLEVDPSETPTAADKINSVTKIENLLAENEKTISGSILAGRELEISHIAKRLGYLRVRLLNDIISPSGKRTENGVVSSWSHPVLVPLTGDIETFVKSKQSLSFGESKSSDTDECQTISMDALSLPGAPRCLRFITPYWITNNTGTELEYCTSGYESARATLKEVMSPRKAARASKMIRQGTMKFKTKKSQSFNEFDDSFCVPTMLAVKNDRLAVKVMTETYKNSESVPVSWKSLGNVTRAAVSDMNNNNDTEWSEFINASTVNTCGELVSGDALMSISIVGLTGAFAGTKLVKLGPRYMVQNKTGHDIQFKVFSSSKPSNAIVNATAGAASFIGKKAKSAISGIRRQSSNSAEDEYLPYDNLPATGLKRQQIAALSCIPAIDSTIIPGSTTERYIMLSLFSDSSTTAWSSAIPITNAGDMYCQLRNHDTGRYMIIEISVQVVEEHIFVVLSDASNRAPYRIENATSHSIRIGFKDQVQETLEPGTWLSFAWYNPAERDRNILVQFESPGGEETKVSYDVERIGYLDPLTVADERRVVAEVKPQGNTRVLRLTDEEADSITNEARKELAQEIKQYYASSIDFRFAGLGLSFYNSTPHELLFISVDHIVFNKPAGGLQWDFIIFHAQIDNMLKRQQFPVLLEPVGSGYSATNDNRSPFCHLKVDATVSKTVLAYELFELRLSPLAIKLDIDYLISVISLFDQVLLPELTPVANDVDLVRAIVFAPMPRPLNLNSGSLLYIETFRIHATAFELEWLLRRSNLEGNSSYLAVEFIMGIISIIGSNLSGSPSLKFNEIVINQCFTNTTSLMNQLVQSYTRQAVMQAYRVLGSTDLLGDPIGLVENLGSGVAQFFRITKGELMGDTATRGEGFVVLGKTLMKSGATSAAKITGSLDRLVGGFVAEEEKASQEGSSSTTAKQEKKTFAETFGHELTGIVRKPIAGAKKTGVSGFVKGTMQGILGPGVAMLKAVTTVSHTLASGAEAQMIDRAPFKGRRRNPKKFVEGALAVHSETEKPSMVKVTVVGANGLLADSSCDSACFILLDGRKVFRTKVIYNSVNPIWDETKAIVLSGREATIQFIVKDSYGALDASIGSITKPIAAFIHDFQPIHSLSQLGQWVQTGVLPDLQGKDGNTSSPDKSIREREYTLTRKASRKEKALSHLVIHVLGAKDLQSTASTSVLPLLGASNPDPFVSLSFKSVRHRTSVKSSTKNPEWNECFTFPNPDKKRSSQVKLKVYGKGMIRNDLLGKASVSLPTEGQEIVEKWVPLLKSSTSTEEVGLIHIRLELSTPFKQPVVEKEETDDIILKAPESHKATVKVGTLKLRCELST